MEALFGLLGSLLSGGATGLIGTGLSKWFAFKEREQNHRQELEMRQLDMQMIRVEAESAERIAAIERETARDVAELDAFKSSLNADVRAYSTGASKWLVFVDVIRGLTRPFLTVLTLSLIACIYFMGNPTDDMKLRITAAVIYIGTTATLWWFGTRPSRSSVEN